MYKNKGRPTLEEAEVMKCPKKLKEELDKLRKELSYEDGTEILLALSIASDEMARAVHMFPEVWYMDVTANTNRQKRGLFLMVVKDPNGETFVGNATVIPSGRGWIFQRIYEIFFLALYGEVTVGRNRLALTDDDDAEHGPFKNCIKTMGCYSKSMHMLCVFHALVLAYNEQVYPLLPRKKPVAKAHEDTGKKPNKSDSQKKELNPGLSKKSKTELSEVGEIYGEQNAKLYLSPTRLCAYFAIY